MWINEELPNLAAEGYELTSDPNSDYNCIAYAAGDTERWWSHVGGYDYYWPEHASRTSSIVSLIEVFTGLGYEPSEDAVHEPGFRKIALYADQRGDWTHAALQLPGGRWTSKLGPDEDISHRAPESLDSAAYGEVHCFMRLSL